MFSSQIPSDFERRNSRIWSTVRSSSKHDILNNFFSRHKFIDYSTDKYIYSMVRVIKNKNQCTDVTYIHYHFIGDNPQTEIMVSNLDKITCYKSIHTNDTNDNFEIFSESSYT